jgi:PadR family transcriptional regulator PadR
MEKELQKILSGFIRLHILHHAAEQPVYGHWMMEELRDHGYSISPGTMYPMLRNLERTGLLRSVADSSLPRKQLYSITPSGLEVLQEARGRLQELFNEVGKGSTGS